MQMAEQLARLQGREVTDAGTWEEHQRVMQGEVVRQLQFIGEIGAGGVHFEPGIVRGQTLRAGQ